MKSIALLGTIAALVAAPASAAGREITFTVVRNASYGDPDLTAFPSLRVRSHLRTVEITAFAGLFPTGGYSIHIRRLTVEKVVAQGGTTIQLCVHVEITAPPPDALVIQAITWPHEIVTAHLFSFGREGPDVWVLQNVRGRAMAWSKGAVPGLCR